MSHVEKRGPRRWLAVYNDPTTGKRRSRSFERKVDADTFLKLTGADQLRGLWVDPRAGRITVRQYGADWLAHRDIRPTTRERYEGYVAYINLLGDIALADLLPSHIEEWQSGLRSHLAASTTGTIRGVFAAMLISAVRDRKIVSSPMVGVRAPKPERTLVVPMPKAVVMSIHDAMTLRYRPAVSVGAMCGLRRGETFGLTVDRVDFLRRKIIVDRGLVQIAGQPPYLSAPKTAASVREVPAPKRLLDELAGHVARYGLNLGDPLFTTTRGALVGRGTFGPAWHRAGGAPGTRFHDLRHHYASTLIAGGESVTVVQDRLGHATAAETLNTYAHLFPDNEDRTRSIIEAAFEPDVSVKETDIG